MLPSISNTERHAEFNPNHVDVTNNIQEPLGQVKRADDEISAAPPTGVFGNNDVRHGKLK